MEQNDRILTSPNGLKDPFEKQTFEKTILQELDPEYGNELPGNFFDTSKTSKIVDIQVVNNMISQSKKSTNKNATSDKEENHQQFKGPNNHSKNFEISCASDKSQKLPSLISPLETNLNYAHKYQNFENTQGEDENPSVNNLEDTFRDIHKDDVEDTGELNFGKMNFESHQGQENIEINKKQMNIPILAKFRNFFSRSKGSVTKVIPETHKFRSDQDLNKFSKRPSETQFSPEKESKSLLDLTFSHREILKEEQKIHPKTRARFLGQNAPSSSRNDSSFKSLKAYSDIFDSSFHKKLSQPEYGTKEKLVSEDPLRKISQGQAKIKGAVNRRRYTRYFLYFGFLSLFSLFIYALFYLIKENTVLLSGKDNLSFVLDNCTLIIKDHSNNEIESPLYVKYQKPRRFKLSENEDRINVDITSNPKKIEIKNELEPRYCLIQLFVRHGTPIASLQVECDRCNITQETSFQFEVESLLEMSGNTINANFRDIKVGALLYRSTTGYLQLSNIDSSPGTNNIIMENEGDIIIQSTKDFEMDVTTSTQAFCFNAPAIVKKRSINCAISGDSTTDIFVKNKDCNVVYDICKLNGCSAPATKYTILANSSNVYANLIEAVNNPVSTTGSTLVKGQIYDQGIQLSQEVQDYLTEFNTLIADRSEGNPFIILNLGNIQSKSSKYSKWVISSVPAYSRIKPWWIGTMSATLLNGYIEQVSGSLSPGFCPFFPEYTQENLYEIQNLLTNIVKSKDTLITLVADASLPSLPLTPRINTGIFDYSLKDPSDLWYTLTRSSSGEIVLIDNNWESSQGAALAAVGFSFVIACIIGYFAISVTVSGIRFMYKKLYNLSFHLQNYIKLEQSKIERDFQNQREKEEFGDKKSQLNFSKKGFFNFLKQSPSPFAFIDYLMYNLYCQFSNSASSFYRLLFREVAAVDIEDQEMDPHRDMITGNTAKLMYEKFCFLNHLNEEKLSSESSNSILWKYGFMVDNQEDMLCEVFTKIIIKRHDNFTVNFLIQEECCDSLDLYVKENIEFTEFTEDQIESETFIERYNSFCDYNRLAKVLISPSLMKEKFNITTLMTSQKVIKRIKTQEDAFKAYRDLSIFQKFESCINFFKKRNNSLYVIDTSKLERRFKLLIGQIIELTKEELQSATSDLILYPKWWVWDTLTVTFHIVASGMIVFPLIMLNILVESQYEPWSLKEPRRLIALSDIYRDPLALLVNLYSTFTFSFTIITIVSVIFVLSILDLLVYYRFMDFPQDKSFIRLQTSTESTGYKISRMVEWGLVLIILTFYFSYIGLVLTWAILGALIDPNSFLPVASSAFTFLMFIVTNYKSLVLIIKHGKEHVLDYLKTLMENPIQMVLEKMTQTLEKNAKMILNQDKSSSDQQNNTFRFKLTELFETGIIDSETSANINRIYQNLVIKQKTYPNKSGQDSWSNANEIENLINSIKEKVVHKIHQECDQKKIPTSITSLLVAKSLGNQQNIQILAQKLIEECDPQNKFEKSDKKIIIKLLFPKGPKNEIITYITNKIVKLALKKRGQKQTSKLTAEVLMNILNNSRNLLDNNIESFVQILKDLLQKSDEHYPIIEHFLPALDILCNLNKEKNGYWMLKEPVLHFLFSIVTFISADEKNIKILKDFTKFLSLICVKNGLEYDIDTRQPLDTQATLDIIRNFVLTLFTEKSNSERKTNKRIELITSVIYTIIICSRQEIHNFPKQVITDLAAFSKSGNITHNEFINFCFNFSSIVFMSPEMFSERLDKCYQNFGLNIKLQSFLKMVTCYSFDEFGIFCPSMVEKNVYLLKIAECLKISPVEVLGLIDFLYQKPNSKYTDVLFEKMLARTGLNNKKLTTLKLLIDLFTSNDEIVLLQAINGLKLPHARFLLVGKNLLDPAFIPGKEFNSFGIKDKWIRPSKSTFHVWRKAIREEFGNQENLKGEGQLLAFYLSDWEKFVFSPTNLAKFLTILDNSQNNLRNIFLYSTNGTSTAEIDFLSMVLSLKKIMLEKGKRFERFSDEKINITFNLAKYLNVKTEGLINLLKLFLINDQDVLSECFMYFFRKETDDLEMLKRVFNCSFMYINIMRNQIDFATNKFSKYIDPEFGANPEERAKYYNFPIGIYKKMFFGDFIDIQLSINDILQLTTKFIQSHQQDDKEKIIESCYMFTLFAKGLLSETELETFLKIKDKKLLQVLTLFMKQRFEERMGLLTSLFKDKDHPIKISIALHGLFTHQSFRIRHTEDPLSGLKYTIKEETIKSYLAKLYDVHPEFFDLFQNIFERDPAKFFSKACPLVRRIMNSPTADVNLIESLFLFLLGNHFNTTYLSRRLDISPDSLDFFVSLMRLGMKPTRKKELEYISDSLPFNRIFEKLKIKKEELIALVKLVFNLFDENDDQIADILNNLGIKTSDLNEDSSEKIDVQLFKGFATLNKHIDPTKSIRKSELLLNDLKLKVTGFFNSIGLGDYLDIGFIISRLTAGDFLVIKVYADVLDWAFPNDNLQAQSNIIDLTMSICGLINSNVVVTDTLANECEFFAQKEDEALQNNTLAYAIHLAYSKLDINPLWTQAFLLNMNAIQKITERVDGIEGVFVLAIVLNFTHMSDCIRDFWGLYEWHRYCKNFYCKDTKDPLTSNNIFLSFDEEIICQYFAYNFSFDLEEVKKLAFRSGLLQNGDWHKLSSDYNKKINKSLAKILNVKISEDLTNEIPSKFIYKLSKSQIETVDSSNIQKDMVIIGELIKSTIIKCYKMVENSVSGSDGRIKGYELTNLSMLGMIVSLRTNSDMTYERKVYNLHQLAMNIERKMYLEDDYHQMSKFKLIKLAGISLGMQISSIFEWYLPPSLFTNEYVNELTKENSDYENRLYIQKKYCKDFALESKKSKVGYLGTFEGSYQDYQHLLERILKTEDWDSTNNLLGVSEKGFGDPSSQLSDSLEKNGLFSQCKIKSESSAVYLPQELVTQLFDNNGQVRESFDDQQRMKRSKDNELNKKRSNTKSSTLGKIKNEDIEKSRRNSQHKEDEIEDHPLKAKLIDAKTSLTYKRLEKSLADFEEVLINPNMILIQGIIARDLSVMSKGEHVISNGDKEKKRSKLYMGLLGLLSFRKRQKQDRTLLRYFLGLILSLNENDMTKIEELISFFITGKPLLNEVANVLEINERNFDIISSVIRRLLRPKSFTKEGFKNISKALNLGLITSSGESAEKILEALELIVNVYHCEEDSWFNLLNKLYKNLPQSEDGQKLQERSLEDLIKLINFEKLKKTLLDLEHLKINAASGISQDFYNFVNLKTDKYQYPTKFFQQFILLINTKSTNEKEDELLTKIHNVVFSIMKLDIPQIFEKLFIDEPQTLDNNVSLLDNLLNVFGIQANKAETQKLKILITLASGKLSNFRSNKEESYLKFIENILNETFNSKVLSNEKNCNISQLLLSTLGWDLQLLIQTFDAKGMKDEASLLYKIYEYFNLSSFLSLNGEDKRNTKDRLEALLSDLTYKFFSKGHKLLEIQSKEVMNSLQKGETKKLQNLYFQVAEKSLEIKEPMDNNFEICDLSISPQDFMISICNGTILTKLIRLSPDLRGLLLELTKFLLVIQRDGSNENIRKNIESFIKEIQNLTRSHENIWDSIFKIAPKVMEMYFDASRITNKGCNNDQIKIEMLKIIKKSLQDSTKINQNQINLLSNLMSLVLGLNINLIEEISPSFLKRSLNLDEKIEIFFTKVLPEIYQEFKDDDQKEFFISIYHIVTKLKTAFNNHYNDQHKLRRALRSVIKLLSKFGFCDHKVIDSVIGLLEGHVEESKPLLDLLLPKKISDKSEKLERMIENMSKIKGFLDFKSVNQQLLLNENQGTNKKVQNIIESENWEMIVKKVKEKTATSKELYQLVEQIGERDGSISVKEMQILACRLGLNLSQHRIKEIFAKVKGSKTIDGMDQGLDEKEFEKALNYLQMKNLYQALKILGITPEILSVIYIWFAILLVLLLIFLYFGIKAFGIAGTFGAIINSLFPMAGGFLLSKKSSPDKTTLNSKAVEEAADTAFQITSSEDL